jgi:hypothetical protein
MQICTLPKVHDNDLVFSTESGVTNSDPLFKITVDPDTLASIPDR